MALSGGRFPSPDEGVPSLQRCPLRESVSPCIIPLAVGLAARFLPLPTSVNPPSAAWLSLSIALYYRDVGGGRCRVSCVVCFRGMLGGTMRSLRLLYVIARSELACAGVAFPRDAGGTIRSLRLLHVP